MRGILTLLTALVLASASAVAQMDDGNMTDDGSTGGAMTGPMDGMATGVTIEEAVGTQVCWSVAGSGRVGHVAIHWDDVSHATGANGTTGDAAATTATFADYDLGAAYPNDTAELASEGYALPARFCANVTAPAAATGTGGAAGGTTGSGGTTGANGTGTGGTTLYVVAHAIDVGGAPGLLSREIMVTVAGTTGTGATIGTGGTPGTGGTTGTGANDTGDAQESNPPASTPGAGVLAAVAVVGLAAFALRRR